MAENGGFNEVRFDDDGKFGSSADIGGWVNSGTDGSGENDTNGGGERGWAKTDKGADAVVSSDGW